MSSLEQALSTPDKKKTRCWRLRKMIRSLMNCIPRESGVTYGQAVNQARPVARPSGDRTFEDVGMVWCPVPAMLQAKR